MSETSKVPCFVYETKDDARRAYDDVFSRLSASLKDAGVPAAVIAFSVMYYEGDTVKVLVKLDGCGNEDMVDQIVAKIPLLLGGAS